MPVKVIEAKDVKEIIVSQPGATGEQEEMMKEVQDLLQDTSKRIEHVEEMVNKMDTTVLGAQKSVEEKIHSEGVKIYRNIQAVLVDLEKKMATQEKMNQEIQNLRNYLKGLMGISAITMIILVIFVLFSIGVF